jgi:NAD(P)-dependent dehydrogenase (short-subunit alcohol dehydrogenase family)
MTANVHSAVMGERRVAVVTGASRGIGKACALRLAARGFDIVATARTVDGSAPFAGTRSGDPEAGSTLPGSLDELADEVRAAGVGFAPVPLDLSEVDSVHAAAGSIVDAFGRVDVLIDNAIAQIPGLNDPVGDVTADQLAAAFAGTALHPFLLVRHLLPKLVEHGDGVVVHLTSGAAVLDPRTAGAWGIGYAMSKAAAHKMIGVLQAEDTSGRLRAYNLNPGHVVTEVSAARAVKAGRVPTGDSPNVPAAAVEWLVDGSPEARALAGRTVVARQVVEEHDLMP